MKTCIQVAQRSLVYGSAEVFLHSACSSSMEQSIKLKEKKLMIAICYGGLRSSNPTLMMAFHHLKRLLKRLLRKTWICNTLRPITQSMCKRFSATMKTSHLMDIMLAYSGVFETFAPESQQERWCILVNEPI